ncbi:unnamed protein product [Paramecium sonneborni]|uniref:Uncharacterized protein n=1 Tax=Paramecium sonneborni TaxID=65129 RepID=A0A8S1KVB2_9CILI|nr:unnamed protein product [Paramecium sonneborni]
MNKIEVLKQGNQITNQLRDELVNLFSMTDTEDDYLLSNRAQTIKSEIEQRFKYRWTIILFRNDAQFESSFVFAEEFILELKSEDYGMLAYIIPDQPLNQYEPRRDFGVRKPYYKDVIDQQQFQSDNSPISYPGIRYHPTYYP